MLRELAAEDDRPMSSEIRQLLRGLVRSADLRRKVRDAAQDPPAADSPTQEDHHADA